MAAMMNCRSISQGTWDHARKALIFFFSRRHGLDRAEDLAQDTLTAILTREDYYFEKEEDFLRVCHGFAAHILHAAGRELARRAGQAVGDPPAAGRFRGLEGAELATYLKEVLDLGQLELEDSDWRLIERNATEETGNYSDPATANRTRVKLHRARRKLALLSGWRKD